MQVIKRILDENSHRNFWRKGLITKVFPGSDGQIRSVELKTMNGVITRPDCKVVKFADEKDL